MGVKKLGAVVAVAVALGGLFTGCGSPSESREERQARMEPILLAVSGVTGGSLEVTNAGMVNLYKCRLTSDAPDTDALKAVLTDVLRTLATEADDAEGSMVSCGVSNQTEGVASHDVGLANPTYFSEIREKLG